MWSRLVEVQVGVEALDKGDSWQEIGSAPLHQQAEMLRLALEASPTGMLMLDDDGRIVLVNAQVEKLFGYPRGELIGVPVEKLVPPRFRAAHPAFRQSFLMKPSARPMGAGRDLYGLRHDGEEVPIEIGLNPFSSGGRTYVLSSVVDITERKRAQEDLARQNREREVLLKEVYHRVKNNLQIICSLLSLQAQQVGDPRSEELLEESRNRVLSIGLVHELLYQSDDLANIDFSIYVQHLISHLRGVFRPNMSIVVRAEIDDVQLPVDRAVPCGLLINELVTNAMKHAFPDDRQGEVVVAMSQVESGRVKLGVFDNGVGLPAHVRPGQSETLGLDLVYGLSRQLQAELTVSSVSGTAFELIFSNR